MIHPLLAALLTTAAPAAPGVCSLVAYDFQREDERAFFVAAPLPDTVLAGMGGVRLGMFPEAPRPGLRPQGAVFGQVARLDRIGGRDSAAVEAALAESESREVVLVPWGFDPGCRPAAWRESARWAELGIPGFYVARLREREHWAGARPTFDVFFAGRYPYPTGSFFRAAAPAARALTAAEYFDLYAALPPRRTPYAQRHEAGRRLWEWARDNAEIAAREPAVRILDEARRHFGWSEADVRRWTERPAEAGGAP